MDTADKVRAADNISSMVLAQAFLTDLRTNIIHPINCSLLLARQKSPNWRLT